MGQKMSLSSRRELLDRLRPRYKTSSWNEKRAILDEFVSASGYHRKYAVTVLNHEIGKAAGKRRTLAQIYDEAVRLALITVFGGIYRRLGAVRAPLADCGSAGATTHNEPRYCRSIAIPG